MGFKDWRSVLKCWRELPCTICTCTPAKKKWTILKVTVKTDLPLTICPWEKKSSKNTLLAGMLKKRNIYTTATNYRADASQQYVNGNSSSRKVIYNSASMYTNLVFIPFLMNSHLRGSLEVIMCYFLIIYFWTLKINNICTGLFYNHNMVLQGVNYDVITHNFCIWTSTHPMASFLAKQKGMNYYAITHAVSHIIT